MGSLVCAVRGCVEVSHCKKMCRKHYLRNTKVGSPYTYSQDPSLYGSIKEKFFSRVQVPDVNGCMVYTGHINDDGYGRFRLGKNLVMAHRFSYETFMGPIPEDMTIDHGCFNRSCVAPAHLEPTTAYENKKRGTSFTHWSDRDTCVNGHEYTTENTRIDKRKVTRSFGETYTTVRVCRQCQKDAKQRAWEKRLTSERDI